MMGAAALDLSPGAGVVLDEVEWLVERQEPHLGRVQLVRGDGERQRVSFRFLVSHPHPSRGSRAPSTTRIVRRWVSGGRRRSLSRRCWGPRRHCRRLDTIASKSEAEGLAEVSRLSPALGRATATS